MSIGLTGGALTRQCFIHRINTNQFAIDVPHCNADRRGFQQGIQAALFLFCLLRRGQGMLLGTLQLRELVDQFPIELLQFYLCSVLFRDIASFNKNAGDFASTVLDRLKDKSDETLFPEALAEDAAIRLPCRARHRVYLFGKPHRAARKTLPENFRQRVAYRLADRIAITDQLQISFVDQLENMGRLSEHGHSARRLLEQLVQPFVLVDAMTFIEYLRSRFNFEQKTPWIHLPSEFSTNCLTPD